MRNYIDWKFKDENILELFQVLEKIKQMILNYRPIGVNQVKEIGKLRKECYSPEFDPNSLLFRSKETKDVIQNSSINSPF
jgi:hypothetical protein